MAIQIVMDATGDTRHHFAPDNASEISEAERRFNQLTSSGFTAAARLVSGDCDLFAHSIRQSRRPSSSRGSSEGSLQRFRSRRAGSDELRLAAIQELYRLSERERTPDARSRQLLRSWLPPGQLETFDKEGYLDVVGSATGRTYRIYYSSVSNIRELNDTGVPVEGLCFVPAAALPIGDVVLAQKIVLENDEPRALAIANRFPSTSRPILPEDVRRARS